MKFKINWDAFGIAASVACAIHCAVLPLILSSLPLFGINIIELEPRRLGLMRRVAKRGCGLRKLGRAGDFATIRLWHLTQLWPPATEVGLHAAERDTWYQRQLAS